MSNKGTVPVIPPSKGTTPATPAATTSTPTTAYVYGGQPFPAVDNTGAPNPTTLWDATLKAPYPTCKPWMNFVLKEGRNNEVVHPYMIRNQLNGEGKSVLSICYPGLFIEPNGDYMFATVNSDINVSCAQGLGPHKVVAYDDLSVTLRWSSSASPSANLTAPLVYGSPYITVISTGCSPVLTTVHAFTDMNITQSGKKLSLRLNNGQTWLVYGSVDLGAKLVGPQTITVAAGFTGVIRISCLLPNAAEDEVMLDQNASIYPTGGRVDFSPKEVVYNWSSASWDGKKDNLLMVALLLHRKLLRMNASQNPPRLKYQTMDGLTQAVVGVRWSLQEPKPLTITWQAPKKIANEADMAELRAALDADISGLNLAMDGSSYFNGKILNNAARLALIAEMAGRPDLVTAVINKLKVPLTQWLDGKIPSNRFMYDKKWGGIVTQNGAKDQGADFGNGIYNDHHFHYGMFIYAGAVLAKFDGAWGAAYRTHLYALAKDFANFDGGSREFPRLRSFDPWKLHSWASGLFDFNDGRNQESTSEAVHAYYAMSLLGNVFGDSKLEEQGRTLATLETRATQMWWHVPSASTIYNAPFTKKNRIVGVLWGSKRDSGLWFAPASLYEIRAGINILPVTPATEYLFSNVDYVKELVKWVEPSLQRTEPKVEPGWARLYQTLPAIFNRAGALQAIKNLGPFADTNSYSNMLWWVFTR